MTNKTTEYGFDYGAAKVVRHYDDPRGTVCIGIITPSDRLEIRVTKGGKIRVARNGVEMKAVAK